MVKLNMYIYISKARNLILIPSLRRLKRNRNIYSLTFLYVTYLHLNDHFKAILNKLFTSLKRNYPQ